MKRFRSRHRRLLELMEGLPEADQAMVLAFAEFLVQRRGMEAPAPAPAPESIPRPGEESVVAAIRRLVKTYPMLERREMLHETSELMSQHVMQGRPAREVIDDLEALFARHYDRYREEDEDRDAS